MMRLRKPKDWTAEMLLLLTARVEVVVAPDTAKDVAVTAPPVTAPINVVAVTVPDTVMFPAFVTVTASSVVAPVFPTPRRTVPSGVAG
jgi:hypothetical protein